MQLQLVVVLDAMIITCVKAFNSYVYVLLRFMKETMNRMENYGTEAYCYIVFHIQIIMLFKGVSFKSGVPRLWAVDQ